MTARVRKRKLEVKDERESLETWTPGDERVREAEREKERESKR